jgi:hypothetical protein
MFNIANASNGGEAAGFGGFIPLIIMGLFFGITLRLIAKRKGKSEWGWFFAGFVPGWNFFGGLWLASLPDISVTEAISSLVDELKKYEFTPKQEQPPEEDTKTWKCNCGEINEMDTQSCPECGLKRDYLLKGKGQ